MKKQLLICLVVAACTKENTHPQPNKPGSFDVQLSSNAADYPYVIFATVDDISFKDTLNSPMDTSFSNINSGAHISLTVQNHMNVPANAIKVKIAYAPHGNPANQVVKEDTADVFVFLP